MESNITSAGAGSLEPQIQANENKKQIKITLPAKNKQGKYASKHAAVCGAQSEGSLKQSWSESERGAGSFDSARTEGGSEQVDSGGKASENEATEICDTPTENTALCKTEESSDSTDKRKDFTVNPDAADFCMVLGKIKSEGVSLEKENTDADAVVENIRDKIINQRSNKTGGDLGADKFKDNFERIALIYDLRNDETSNEQNNNIVDFKMSGNIEPAAPNDVLQIFTDGPDNLSINNKANTVLSAENKYENYSLEAMLANQHIETHNKLDQILKYIQEELDQERFKRCLLEKKLDAITKLIDKYESQLN